MTVQRQHHSKSLVKTADDTCRHAVHRPRKGSDFCWEGFLPLWALEAVLAGLVRTYCTVYIYIYINWHEYHPMKSWLHLLPTRVWGGVNIHRIVTDHPTDHPNTEDKMLMHSPWYTMTNDFGNEATYVFFWDHGSTHVPFIVSKVFLGNAW